METLMGESNLPFNAVPFDQIKSQDFIPALTKSLKTAREKLNTFKQINEAATFQNTIVVLEELEDEINYISNIYYALYSAHCDDGLTRISSEFSNLLTEFQNDISLDPVIFSKIKNLYEIQESLNLSIEEQMILKKYYSGFVRSGATLSDVDKETYREIELRLSKLSIDFGENVRNEKNEFFLQVPDDSSLKELPRYAIDQAKDEALKRDLDGLVFTADYPSYAPFIKFCNDRELRKKMYLDSSKETRSGRYSNQGIILEILKLREKRAKLLGYSDHAAFVLENRMAKEKEKVFTFMDELFESCYEKAKVEIRELKDLFELDYPQEEMAAFDQSYYSNKLKQKKLNFDSEKLRPYFKLENVVNGVFDIAGKLFDLKFKRNNDIPTYHNDVEVYEVSDDHGFVGLFYCDFFPRKEKRGGAWMTNIRSQGLEFGQQKRPHVMIVCNFTKPTSSQPSLLSLPEVETLFHEFGHALHGLLSKCKYRYLSGTHVLWDFVELPSQIMENWVSEKESLDLFARHYKDKNPIPDEYIKKVKQESTFLSALACLRQLSLSTLDMQIHSTDSSIIDDCTKFEKEVTSKFRLLKDTDNLISTKFSHIFAGGYSAGYYSYKWAEVLDADAFSAFKESGIFNKEIATSFKENILEKGGSIDPEELYISFRKRAPSIDALLERSGLQ